MEILLVDSIDCYSQDNSDKDKEGKGKSEVFMYSLISMLTLDICLITIDFVLLIREIFIFIV